MPRGSQRRGTCATAQPKGGRLSTTNRDADGHASEDREDGRGPRGVAQQSRRYSTTASHRDATEKVKSLGPQATASRDAKRDQREALAGRRVPAPLPEVVSTALLLLTQVHGVTHRVGRERPKVSRAAVLSGLNIDDNPRGGAIEAAENDIRAFGEGGADRRTPVVEGPPIAHTFSKHTGRTKGTIEDVGKHAHDRIVGSSRAPNAYGARREVRAAVAPPV